MTGPTWEFFIVTNIASNVFVGGLVWWLAEQFRKTRHAKANKDTPEVLLIDVMTETKEAMQANTRVSNELIVALRTLNTTFKSGH